MGVNDINQEERENCMDLISRLTDLLHRGDAPIGPHWSVIMRKSDLIDAVDKLKFLLDKVDNLTASEGADGRALRN